MKSRDQINLGRDVEHRYLGGFLIRDHDGSIRVIRNIEMAANLEYRKHARKWEAAGDRWRQLFLEWLNEPKGSS